MGKLIDLTGKRFGRLTVVKRADDYVTPNGQHRPRWMCKCDCGNEAVVWGMSLRNKTTQSCGCLHRERFTRKKYNDFDLSGDYGIGYDCNGIEFYFDLEDYEKIKDYCWVVSSNGYVVSRSPNNSRKVVLLHRLIMNCFDESLYVDHIHGDESKRDNRKSNLRIATPYQNNVNKRMLDSNTSGVTGISWNKRKDKWEAYIGVNGKRLGLGYFKNFDDAVVARKAAEEKYFGEWSYDNSQASSNV